MSLVPSNKTFLVKSIRNADDPTNARALNVTVTIRGDRWKKIKRHFVDTGNNGLFALKPM